MSNPLANLTWLDFNPAVNCQLATQVIGKAILEDEAGSSISMSESLLDFVRISGPTPLDNVTYDQVFAWNSADISNYNMSILNLTDRADQHCHLDLCLNLDYQGNPDISGIGVGFDPIMQLSAALMYNNEVAVLMPCFPIT